MTKNSDQLQVEGKLIPDNTNWLPGQTRLELGKTEPMQGKIELESGYKIR
jgi:hypothetical protein